ncbi:MAG: DUF1173 family protein, partial [Rhodoferax sp.]|nr:DUF1173 family protein [Rhodoferax sp.]
MASATLSNLTAAQSKSVHILVGGEHFDLKRLRDSAQAERFQAALDSARHKFGHALCMCRPAPLKL